MFSTNICPKTYSTIFKTFDSDIDKISAKWGIFGKSFNDFIEASNKRKIVIDDLFTINGIPLKDAKKQAGSFWSYLYPSKESIKSQLIDVDALYPDIGDATASKLLTKLQKEQILVNANKKSWQDYFKDLKEGEKWQIEFVQNTDLQKASLDDVKGAYNNAREAAIAHNAALKQETLGAKAAAFGLKALTKTLTVVGDMLLSMGTMLAVQAAITAFTHLYNISDKLSEKVQELTDNLNSETEELSSMSDELADINKKLVENSKRYSELINKQKESGLTIEESGELKNLQDINMELINQKNILEENIRLKKESAAATGQELADSIQWQESVSNFFNSDFGEFLKVLNDLRTFVGNLPYAIAQTLEWLGADIPEDSWISKLMSVMSGESLISWVIGADINKDSVEDTVSKYEKIQKEIDAIRKKYDADDDGIINNGEGANMSDKDKDKLAQYKDDLADYSKSLQAEYKNIDDSIKAIEKDPELVEANTKDLEKLKSLRDIIAEILDYNNESNNGNTIIDDKDIETVNKTTSALSDMKSASESISSLQSAFKELSDDGYITIETISKIQEATGLSGDAWEEYQNKLMTAKKGSDEFNQVLSSLTYSILENKFASVGLENATEEQIAAILRENGVVNASTVAHDILATAIEKSAYKKADDALASYANAAANGELTETSYETAAALIAQCGSADITNQAMLNLKTVQDIFSNSEIDVESKIKALQSYGAMAGWTAQQIAMISNGGNVTLTRSVDEKDGKMKWWTNYYEKDKDKDGEKDYLYSEEFKGFDFKMPTSLSAIPQYSSPSSSSSKGANDTADKINDAKEKLEELNKSARLDNLKNEISSADLTMSHLKDTLDSLSESFDNLFEGDYIGKQAILSQEFETAAELGKQYREEFERLAQIQPQSADEANELANRLETLGSSIRENVNNLTEYTKQINELRINAITGYGENVSSQLKREFELIDRNISALTEGSVFGDSFSFDFLYPSIPESAIDKQRKANDKALEEEKKYNDEIYNIKKKALELEAAENAKSREKERQELLKSLNENKTAVTNIAAGTSQNVISEAEKTAATVENIGSTMAQKTIEMIQNIKSELGGLDSYLSGLTFGGNIKLDNNQTQVVSSILKELFATGDISSSNLYKIGYEKAKNAGITARQLEIILQNIMGGYGGGEAISLSAKNPFAQYGVTSGMSNGRTVMGKTRAHKGVDYGLPMGTKVPAPVGGIVRTGIDPGGFGNYAVVTDSQGYQQWFGHLSQAYSNLNGKTVKAGTVIGLSGSTGRSTGPHLHYEIRTPNGGRLHPDTYLSKRANGGTVGKGETTLVNELGQESAILPNGKFVLLGKEAKLVDMPIGTQVINHKDTNDILKYAGNSVNGSKIQKLADGNTEVKVESSSNQNADNVTINAKSVDVNADENKNKELEAWIEKYTSSSSYDTYSPEFHKKYAEYVSSKDERLNKIAEIQERLDKTTVGTDEYQKLKENISVEYQELERFSALELAGLKIDMANEKGEKLKKAYNDLLWEYKDKINQGESAEVLKKYQDGLGVITDQIGEVNDEWLSAHESQRDYLISLAEKTREVFDSNIEHINKEIDNTRYELDMLYATDKTPNITAENNSYEALMKGAEKGANEAAAQQEMSHVNANNVRREYNDVVDFFGSDVIDSWYDSNGEIIQEKLDKSLAAVSSSEMKQRTKTMAELLQADKEEWHSSEEERKNYIKDYYDYQDEMRDVNMDREQKAFDEVVEMIKHRKEQELEAIEEIHERTVELLDKRREIIEDMYSRQLELLDDVKTEEDYQRSLNEETDKLNQIQLEIDKYALIDTNSARTKVSELQKQLEEQQEVIDEKQREKEYQDKKNALEEDRDLLLDALDQKVEDENNAYEDIKEAVEDRYTDEKIYAEAMDALLTGKLATFVENSCTSYNQIGTAATTTIKKTTDAFNDFYVSTGTALDELNKNEISACIEGFSEIITSLKTIKELQEDTGYDFGIGSSDSPDGNVWKELIYRLKNEKGFATTEIKRTYQVIEDRNAHGYDTSEQKAYLLQVAKMEKERALKVIADKKANGDEISKQEKYLKYICNILGEPLPKYHSGKIPNWLTADEKLSIVKDDEMILTKPMTQSLLSKISDVSVLNNSIMPQLAALPHNVPVINNTSPSIGDVTINIQAGNVSKIDKRMLSNWGNQISYDIRTRVVGNN